MINKTTDYSIFKGREDNREVNQPHLKRLMESIKINNLLEYKPILVNGHYEIIDGQHRLLAAKALGLPVFYEMNHKASEKEMLSLNISRSWGMLDYLNFYCKNHYPEYLKLQDFIKKHDISLKVAIHATFGGLDKSKNVYLKFKEGEYKFENQDASNYFELCHETIGYIRKLHGISYYTTSGKFWEAFMRVAAHDDFNAETWRKNMQKLSGRFSAKVTIREYLVMFLDIYNYRQSSRIPLSDLVKDFNRSEMNEE